MLEALNSTWHLDIVGFAEPSCPTIVVVAYRNNAYNGDWIVRGIGIVR
jgi:hypothetical protein